MVDYNEDFQTGDSGASLTYPVGCGNLKKGGYIVLGDGRPCKIVEITTSKTGKHGHAKANITAIDIFTSKKFEDVQPVSHSKDVPNVKRIELQVVTIDDDGYVTLMDEKGKTRSDLKLPDDSEDDKILSEKIKIAVESSEKNVFCSILSAMNIEKIVDFKEA